MIDRSKELPIYFFLNKIVYHGWFLFFLPITCDLFFVALLNFAIPEVGKAPVLSGAIQVSAKGQFVIKFDLFFPKVYEYLLHDVFCGFVVADVLESELYK